MEGQVELIVGLIGGLIGFCVILIVCLVPIIGVWKTYTKAGQSGWASIIPIYNNYVIAKIVYGEKLGYIGIVGILIAYIPVIGTLASMIFWVYTWYYLFKAYNCTGGTAILYTIFPLIGFICIGFGKSSYIGVQDNMITQKLTKE
ncbi:MAG: DUF5684 domain-containing protein [Eubacteriales bacterium]